MKKRGLYLLLISILLINLFAVGYKKLEQEPQTVYRVYLKGKSIGLIKSKKALEEYIDKEQEHLKKKYKVDKVYIPDDLDIVKEITYNKKIATTKAIYEKIQDKTPFTINGYAIVIKGLKTQNNEGKKITTKDQTIYVLDRKVFTNSLEKAIKSFVKEEDYENFKNDKQKEIKDVGKIIENIYIENKITIKKQNIPVTATIYMNEEDLSKYLLFGTTKEQQKYTVKEGDTIPDVAFNNKISNEEFLIANPQFKDESSLLFPGQEVTLGILKPQFNLIEEDHVVEYQEKKYTTEIRYDNNKMIGQEEKIQAGVNGQNKVTQKIKKVNGDTNNVVITNTEEIKPATNEIIVKGGKKSSYGSWNGGGSAPANVGEWYWPTRIPYYLSSNFGWRWGALHDGQDIAGCGEGSPIYAAQSGTVVKSGSGIFNGSGEAILIDHHNGYYSMYAHMCPGCRYVGTGANVTKGQVIGGMGHTGFATGTHLHFSIWRGYPYRGGVALNPLNFY